MKAIFLLFLFDSSRENWKLISADTPEALQGKSRKDHDTQKCCLLHKMLLAAETSQDAHKGKGSLSNCMFLSKDGKKVEKLCRKLLLVTFDRCVQYIRHGC